MIGLVFAVYAIIGTMTLAHESPLWLLKKGYSDRAYQVLNRIMTATNRIQCENEMRRLEQLSEKQHATAYQPQHKLTEQSEDSERSTASVSTETDSSISYLK